MEKVKEAALSFAEVTGVPVTCFSPKGLIQWETLRDCKLCSHFEAYKNIGSECRGSLHSSAKTAAQLGRPYIFLCKAGLANIAFSLIINGKVTGCLIAGPLLMGELKESVFSNIISVNQLDKDSYPKILMLLKNLKRFEPGDVSQLASLFENSVLGAVTPNEDYLKVKKQYHEIQKITASLKNLKKAGSLAAYPHEIEAQLIKSVRTGDIAESRTMFQSYFKEVSLFEGGDLPSIRTTMLNVCSVLLRLFVEKTGSDRNAAGLYYANLDAVGEAESLSKLSAIAYDFIGRMAYAFGRSTYSGNSQIIRKAVSYIMEKCTDKISLKKIAESLHTSPSYLSMLFKQEMGLTITDYLNQARIERSCELLSKSTLSLLEISLQSGFEDQSYFSKVFKRINGITPKEYRKMSS